MQQVKGQDVTDKGGGENDIEEANPTRLLWGAFVTVNELAFCFCTLFGTFLSISVLSSKSTDRGSSSPHPEPPSATQAGAPGCWLQPSWAQAVEAMSGVNQQRLIFSPPFR